MKDKILQRREEFEEVLETYRISEHGAELVRKTDLAILRGPSGGGRNTIINLLIEEPGSDFIQFITDTTRAPREIDGAMEEDSVDYWFKTEDELMEGLKQNNYIEAELIHNRQVSGMSVRELERITKSSKIPIMDLHFGGVNSIRAIDPEALVIFLTPPSFEEWVRRFKNRGATTEDDLKERFATSLEDYKHALAIPNVVFIVNDDLSKAVVDVKRAVKTQDYPVEEKESAKQIAASILERLKKEITPNS